MVEAEASKADGGVSKTEEAWGGKADGHIKEAAKLAIRSGNFSLKNWQGRRPS